MQKAHGDENTDCPLYQKRMSDVCHKCAWWTHIRGINPNTGLEVDSWNCAIAHFVLMQFEIATQIRQVDGTMQAFRTETAQTNIAALALGLGVKPNVVQRKDLPKQLDKREILSIAPGSGENGNAQVGEE